MSKKLTILFFFASYFSFSQFPTVSKYEWLWSVSHPVAAFHVKKITKKCQRAYDPVKISSALDSFVNGGKADAFRHVFFMAAYAQKIKVKKIRKLGIAHEKANYAQFRKSGQEYGEVPDSLGTVMDLKNNESGFKIGTENCRMTLDELCKLAITEIRSGKTLIMNRNRHGEYLDCENKPVDLKLYAGKWLVPKCLVTSDHLYE